jgi:hypothetical protein
MTLLNIAIPEAVFWTTVVSVAAAILGAYLYTRIALVKLAGSIKLLKIETYKDIELLKLQVEKDMEILERIENAVIQISNQQTESNRQLNELDKRIILKQDIKL